MKAAELSENIVTQQTIEDESFWKHHADHLQLNPASGQLFLFRNRAANKIKVLWWDRNGFWLFYKRLEKGRFQFPSLSEKAIELTRDQLGWLLSGLDCMKHALLPEVHATNFY